MDSLLVESGFLIVGFHQKLEGIIKVWNLATAAEHILTGHKVSSSRSSMQWLQQYHSCVCAWCLSDDWWQLSPTMN